MSFIGGLIGGIGSIVGGITSAHAAKSAANAQTSALNNALQFQQGVYGQGVSNLSPFIGAGTNALQSLLGFYGLPGGNATGAIGGFNQFQQTPFYQFPLQQSQLALGRQLAASGLGQSGAALRDATQLASGYAGQGLSTYLQGLSGLITGGQTAATSLLSGGNQAAGTLLSGYGQSGQAQSAGIVGGNNALQSGIGTGLGAIGTSLFGPPNTSGSSYQNTPVPGTGGLIGSNSLIGSLIGAFGGGSGGIAQTGANAGQSFGIGQ